jgi:branched-chain amino acid transport system substrate-binding protein
MRNRTWVVIVAVVGVFALVAAGCRKSSGPSGGGVNCNTVQFGCVTYAKGEPIQLGTLLSISGSTSFLGLDSQHGVSLAVDHLDGTFDGKGGQLLGHPVTLVNEDDGCSAEGGQTGATKLASNTKLVAVIGTSCSSAALGVADKILSDKGILLISPSNTNPNLTAQGTHQPFYLRTAHNDKIQGAVVADFASKQLHAATAATINDESPYADALAAVFRQDFQKLGGRITDVEAIKSTDTDFKPLLTSIGKGKPSVLYFPDFNPACGLISKQSVGIPGLDDTVKMGSDGCADSSFPGLAGAAGMHNTYLTGPDFSAYLQEDFYKNEFLPAYNQQFGKPSSSFHAHAYDAANILFAAIKKVAVQNSDGSLTIPRLKLKDAIFATSGYQGITGTITCTPLGDCATSVTIAVYKANADPATGATGNPVFSETKTLAEAGG